MSFNKAEFQGKVQAGMGAFANNAYMKSISNGMVLVLTPIIVGSFFVLLANFPIKPWTDFITQNGIIDIFNLGTKFTSDCMALYAAFFISFSLARHFNVDGTMSGLLSLIAFLIVSPLGVTGDGVTYIPFDFLGARGLFTAILIALLTGRIYVLFIQKNITIRLPDGVPPAVATSFATLVPGITVVAISLIISAIFNQTPYGNLNEMIYAIVQTPLEGLGSSYGAMIVVLLLTCILWFFGIHGTAVVFGIMLPIWLSLDTQNIEALKAGQELPNIIGFQFVVCYIMFSGTGNTIGLNLLMLFKAKSKQFKTLGKIALPASLFNINEPILFGTPIVLNPFTFIPFIAVPIINFSIAYFSTAVGLVPHLSAIQIPWTTPVAISGFIQGGVRVVLLQLVLIVVSLLAYYIPFKVLDGKAFAQEKEAEKSA